MATIKWINGKSASYQSTTGWSGGVVPGAADTAVISSAGGAAPTKSGQLLVPASGSSQAYLLSGLTLDSLTQHQTTNTSGVTTTYFTTLAPSQVPAGETVSGGIIDMIAGGGESALYLQNSTLGSHTTLNVNGDAYVYAGYTDTLAGAINIGLPFSVGGVAQPQPKADAFGHTSAIYLDIKAWGSWTGANVPASYTPGVNNTGTITIGGGSALVVALNADASSIFQTGPKTATSLPPMASQFDNNGTIKVEAGGLFNTIDTFGGPALIVNNGTVDVFGASGKLTEAVFDANVTGHGLIDLQGGTQTNPAQTLAQFNAQIAGNSFLINDAGLLLQPGQFRVNSSGFTYSGGTVTFGGHSGILEIVAPVENTVAKLFGDTIAGFQSGDTISLHYHMIGSGTWSQQLVWTQATHTLQLFNVFTNSGIQSKALEASFTLNGTYAASSFHISNATWNGQDFAVASVTITTTQTSPGVAVVSADLASGDQATLASHLTLDSSLATVSATPAHATTEPAHLDYHLAHGGLDAFSLHDHGLLL